MKEVTTGSVVIDAQGAASSLRDTARGCAGILFQLAEAETDETNRASLNLLGCALFDAVLRDEEARDALRATA